MTTRRTILAFLGISAVTVPLVTVLSGQERVDPEVPRIVYHDRPPDDPLPDTLDPQQFEPGSSAFVAYVFAARIKAILYQVPCYCPCGILKGHTSLFDCFASTHGSHCHICQQEAIFCYLHRTERPPRIREGIANGEAWTIDLSKSGQLLDSARQTPRK